MFRYSLTNNLIFSFFVLLCIAGSGVAQELQNQSEQIEDVPPPLVTLSKSEADQLKAENDLKQHTVLCLQLAGNRLQQAEIFTTNADFQEALGELGGYQAVIDNGLNYLKALKSDSKKVRDNVRRLEIAIREHAPRLETIRRSTPFEYALRLKTILKFAREARSRALNLFFSNSVVSGNANDMPMADVSGVKINNTEKKTQ